MTYCHKIDLIMRFYVCISLNVMVGGQKMHRISLTFNYSDMGRKMGFVLLKKFENNTFFADVHRKKIPCFNWKMYFQPPFSPFNQKTFVYVSPYFQILNFQVFKAGNIYFLKVNMCNSFTNNYMCCGERPKAANWRSSQLLFKFIDQFRNWLVRSQNG